MLRHQIFECQTKKTDKYNDNNLLLTQMDNSIKSVTQEIVAVFDEYNF